MVLRRVILATVIASTTTFAKSATPASTPAPQASVTDAQLLQDAKKKCGLDDARSSGDPDKYGRAIECVRTNVSLEKDKSTLIQLKKQLNDAQNTSLESLALRSGSAQKPTSKQDKSIQQLRVKVQGLSSQVSLEQANADALVPKPAGPGGSAASNAAISQAKALSVGTNLQASAYTTPSACALSKTNSAAAAGQGVLNVHRQLMYPKDVSDDFGRRLGRRFIVYQVTVTNMSKDFQFEISDISVDLSGVLAVTGPAIVVDNTNYAKVLASGQDLGLLRGIPEKGQDYDPRNMTLHIMQGVGAVGAGVSGLTPFSDVMGPAMANFNGAFLQGLTGVFPDHTANQLNRLSDKAFIANTLIERLQTKVFAVFIPESFVLPKYMQDALLPWHKDGTFWSDPRTLLNQVPLDQVNVCVDGVLLVQVDTSPDPTFSTDQTSAVSLLDPVNVPDKTNVTINDAGASPTIYYTITGDVPNDKSDKFDPKKPITVTKGSDVTVKAFALVAGKAPSNIVTKTFHATEQANPPKTVALDGTSNTTVVITKDNANDTVYYTTDGTPPGPTSNVYTTPIPLPTDGSSITVTATEVGNNTSFSTTTKGGPFKKN